MSVPLGRSPVVTTLLLHMHESKQLVVMREKVTRGHPLASGNSLSQFCEVSEFQFAHLQEKR